MRKCEKCGELLSDNDTICLKCQNNHLVENELKGKRTIKAIVIFSIIAWISFICFFVNRVIRIDNMANEHNYNNNEEVENIDSKYLSKCSNYCGSDAIVYINDNNYCVCDSGEKMYDYRGNLIYSKYESYEYENNISDWYSDVNSNGNVVTVIANSNCSSCIKFKPIIHSVYSKYKFNLHFIYEDKLSNDDRNKFKNMFKLENYNGTPYTYVVSNKEYIGGLSGYTSIKNLENFLIDKGVIQK